MRTFPSLAASLLALTALGFAPASGESGPTPDAMSTADIGPATFATLMIQGREVHVHVALWDDLMPPTSRRPLYASVSVSTPDPRGLPEGLRATAIRVITRHRMVWGSRLSIVPTFMASDSQLYSAGQGPYIQPGSTVQVRVDLRGTRDARPVVLRVPVGAAY